MISAKVQNILKKRVSFNLLINKEESSSPHIYFVNVDPMRVSHTSLMPERACSLSGPDAICGSHKGCFDIVKVPFKNDFMYQTVSQLLNNEDWETTPYFRKLLKYKSRRKTLVHYNKLRRLITILEKDGYLSQYELGKVDITKRIAKWEVPRHELIIGMDRWGQLFRIKGGRHRLAIAHNLEIKKIPAVLMLYHQDARTYLPKERRMVKGNSEDFKPFIIKEATNN